MAPSKVKTPVKAGGKIGRTPDLVALRRTGAGGGTYCAEATAATMGRSVYPFMFAVTEDECEKGRSCRDSKEDAEFYLSMYLVL